MAHHSRAPWHGNERLAGNVRTIWSDDGQFVACLEHPDIPTAPLDEREANGRLLIAATDLLEACKLFMQFDGENCQSGPTHYDDVKRAMVAAIAKAEGKPNLE